jgi:cytochrome c peroxidase
MRRLFLSLIVMAALGCKGGTASGSVLEIAVQSKFNGEPLLLDSLRYQNAAGETLSVTRLSYLLSGFALQTENGAWVEVPDQYAWMDAAKRRSVVRLEGLPSQKYEAVHFYVGPDAAANAADTAKFPADHPLNPNLDGLHWSWQGGFIFLALEGLWRNPAGQLGGYAYHVARNPNRTRISLSVPLDLTHDTALLLNLNVGTLFNLPNPLSIEKDGNSTHSRDGDPVALALDQNLAGAFNVSQVLSSVPQTSNAPPVKPLYLPEKFVPHGFVMGSTFPIPDLPRDNPLIEERVALGEKLFHETALSRDGSISCSSCHRQPGTFSDPRRFSLGVRAQSGKRHAMPLFNLAWKTAFFWDGRAPSLRAAALDPIQDPTEMDETLDRVPAKLGANPAYPPLFRAAFGSVEITPEKVGLALEQYLLTLTAYNSKFDLAMRGKATFTGEEKRGLELFMTEYDPRTGQHGADCFHCHGGPLFTDNQFHNNGLVPDEADPGRFLVTHNEADRNKFATPSLRNVALTGPYMHDGRYTTLEEVVAHYNTGVQRTPTLDPNLAKHPLEGLQLSAADQRALVAFLKTLSFP